MFDGCDNIRPQRRDLSRIPRRYRHFLDESGNPSRATAHAFGTFAKRQPEIEADCMRELIDRSNCLKLKVVALRIIDYYEKGKL